LVSAPQRASTVGQKFQRHIKDALLRAQALMKRTKLLLVRSSWVSIVQCTLVLTGARRLAWASWQGSVPARNKAAAVQVMLGPVCMQQSSGSAGSVGTSPCTQQSSGSAGYAGTSLCTQQSSGNISNEEGTLVNTRQWINYRSTERKHGTETSFHTRN